MKNLLTALAKFQQECPLIVKAKKGYNYKYADLPTILKEISPILNNNGLVFTQPLTERGVKTILMHLESGEMIESEMAIPNEVIQKMNAFQSLGSGITYIRRYALASLLGIVTDEDTDAAGDTKGLAQKDRENRKPYIHKGSEKYKELEALVLSGEKITSEIEVYYSLSAETKKHFLQIEKDINHE